MNECKLFLEKLLPNLYFSEDLGAVWVKRDGRDADAISYSVHSMDIPELVRLNEEAGRALQHGWFFCAKCMEAHPPEHFGNYYMAGKYCHYCLDRYPDLRKKCEEAYYG